MAMDFVGDCITVVTYGFCLFGVCVIVDLIQFGIRNWKKGDSVLWKVGVGVIIAICLTMLRDRFSENAAALNLWRPWSSFPVTMIVLAFGCGTMGILYYGHRFRNWRKKRARIRRAEAERREREDRRRREEFTPYLSDLSELPRE